MAKYVLALDQGTTSSRAILFNADGTIHKTANQEFPQIYPTPGHVEHDPEAIWDSQLAVAKKVISDAGASPDDIAAIGITNQRETTVVWEKSTGKPVQNAIVWQSRITAGYCDELKAAGHEAKFREKTGSPGGRLLQRHEDPPHPSEQPGRAGEGRGRRAAVRHGRQLPHLAPHRGPRPRRGLLERQPHAAVQHQHPRLGRRAAGDHERPARHDADGAAVVGGLRRDDAPGRLDQDRRRRRGPAGSHVRAGLLRAGHGQADVRHRRVHAHQHGRGGGPVRRTGC